MKTTERPSELVPARALAAAESANVAAAPDTNQQSTSPAWECRLTPRPAKEGMFRVLVKESWVVGLLAAGLLASGCKKDAEPSAAAPATGVKAEGSAVVFPADSPQLASVSIETVESQRNPTLRLQGRLVWDETATARVFSAFAGRVTSIVGTVGKTVEAGGALAMIASPDFGQAQADARRAANDVRQAERTLARLQELFANGAAPRKDVESAESDVARAQSERDRAEARLRLYGSSGGVIDQSVALKSPLGGVIVEKNLNPGQEVRPDQMLAGLPQFGAPLFVITDPARLWVILDATENEIHHLKSGLPMVIRSQAYPEASHPGRLEVVSDSFDPTTRTLKVRGLVENPGRTLKAEMLVTAEIELPQASTRSVTTRAVFLKGDRHFVYVEDGRGRFLRREVKVGAESEGKLPILAGLESGQRVVVNGVLLLEQLVGEGAGS